MTNSFETKNRYGCVNSFVHSGICLLSFFPFLVIMASSLLLFVFLSSLDRLSIPRKAEKTPEEIFSKGICILLQNWCIMLSLLLPFV